MRPIDLLALLLLAGSAFITMPVAAIAQDAKDEKKAEPKKDDKNFDDKHLVEIPFFDTDRGFEIRAAVAMVGEANPWRAISTRMAISENVPAMPRWQFVFDRMLPLPRRFLEQIRDGGRIPDLRARQVMDLPIPERSLYLSFLHALHRSHPGSLDLFKKSAEETENVVYPHLAQNARFYRGKVIPVHGRVTAIRESDAPRALKEEHDNTLEKIYWGWLRTETKGAPVYGIVFTELPREIEKPAENLDLNVTFYGYFLAHVAIPEDKQRSIKAFTSPWVIGKTMVVHPKPPVKGDRDDPGTYQYVLFAVGGLCVVVFVVMIMTVWSRRGDRQAQSKIAESREKHQPFNVEAEAESVPEEAMPEGKNGSAPPPAT